MASPEAETILFRPSKKRKTYRQRAVEDDDEQLPSVVSPTAPSPKDPIIMDVQSLDELISSSAAGTAAAPEGTEVEGGAPVSMAEIFRLRKLRSRRAGGVEFRAEGGLGSGSGAMARDGEDMALVLRPEEAGGGGGEGTTHAATGVPRRFAPQTGAVGDVNKHMMEYIDSEMAKRRRLDGGEQRAIRQQAETTSAPERGDAKLSTADIQRQPAALGKLVEIDLGEEARKRNEERTRRKLGGEEVEDEVNRAKKPPKVRLGRDGKPWRGRKRRGSEDIRRDQLVEDVLRENRLDHYDEPVQQQPATVDDDQAADDRIAEAFRQEFMDAIAQRRQKKSAPPAAASRNAPGKKDEDVLKGPKLGGSRNSRAAMRDLMLKQMKK